ncbi:hypothetical protein Golomagni_01224 [Golovinomyces magnicellulatus]|nr:hypothetical protein Golomagni_01224 [Golovinomyces magnicellulatus]
MAPLVRGSAAYKKKDGTICIEQDKKTVTWSPIGAHSDEKAIIIAVKDITTDLQQTPESAAKVMLRIIQKSPDSNEAITYQFHFNSSLNPREEANSVKNILTSAISAIKSLDEGVPKSKIPALPPKSNAVATASIPRSSNASWFDDTQLKNNIELQQTLMKNDPTLHRTYMESRRTKPDNVSDSQFNSQFWSTRTSLLRAYAVETSQQRGSYNVLSSVKPRQVDGELKMNISVEQVQLIFNQHPLVKRVYDENVPKLNDMEFWSRFFLSRLFKKLKGERMVESDNCDAIFDKYLDANNNLSLRNKQHAMQVPHIIDIEGNEENQGGSKSGNRKDFTMRPGSSAKVPIIRTLNSLSEKIMAQVAPSDINPLDPIGMNEETYNSLALRDLQGVSEDFKFALNVKEQSRFFSGDKKSISDEAALYAKKSPSDVLFAFQNELCPTVLKNNAANELDLSIVNSVLDESDSEDDEGQSQVSIKASFQDAEKQIFEGINTRRSEFNNSESRSSLLGLSQRIFDRLSLTHATTIEFLQYFWIIFLSGDPEKAGELAKLVETLERAVSRIEAVAEDAEKERQELISKQKQNIKDVYKTSGRKIQWNPNSVPGGAKVVKEMTEPTIRALEKAAREDARSSMNDRYNIPMETGHLPLREILQPKTVASESSKKKIQRKSSITFNSNSSEDYPSPHASIYEAIHISANSSEDNGHKIELINIPPRKGSLVSKIRKNDENIRDANTTDINQSNESEFLYGRGTLLDTITEQKSFATMKTITRTKSAEDLGSFSLLRQQDSFSLPNSLLRKRSLSLDDYELSRYSYHEACAMIEQNSLKLLPVQEIYADPKIPTEAPLKRPDTPPGMPSWTAAQNLANNHLRQHAESGSQNRLQRRYGLPTSKLSHYSNLPQNPITGGQGSTDHLRGLIAPKFRPPKSAYISLNQHPFSNTRTHKAGASSRAYDFESTFDASNRPLRNTSPRNIKKLSRARLTPSATVRDSEQISYSTNIGLRNADTIYTTSPMHNNKFKRKTSREETKGKILCPHSKGRLAMIRRLNNHKTISRSSQNHSISPENLSRGVYSTHSVSGPSMQNGPDLFSASRNLTRTRSASLSSNAPLMSGIQQVPSPVVDEGVTKNFKEKDLICWKCRVEQGFTKVDRIWLKAVKILCFVCCGFDVHEESDYETTPHEFASAGSGYSRRRRNDSIALRNLTLHEAFP